MCPANAARPAQRSEPFLSAVVAVLFARSDSNYKSLDQTDVWDADRDARKWPGGLPVVAHPPCRAWGRLRHFAKPRDDEKELAHFAVRQVREYGGVLEHPASSSLWTAAGLPAIGERDEFGGWTLPISQHWWGHRAEKKTWLYIVGCAPSCIPDLPMVLGEAECVIGSKSGRKEISKAEREHTPKELAIWLIALAARCKQ